MAKLIIIVGMGGSGKSHLCDEIAKERGSALFKDATLTKNDWRRAGHDCLGEMVARLLGRDEDCVMDEAHLTDANFRNAFKDFCNTFLTGVEQEWIFFEHDVLACINNVFHDAQTTRRDEPSRLKSLGNQVDSYKIPLPHEFPGYTQPRPVFKQPNAKFAHEADAREWLRGEIERLEAKT